MKKMRPYLSPEAEIFILRSGRALLESLSLEGNIDDITEGDGLNSSTDW